MSTVIPHLRRYVPAIPALLLGVVLPTLLAAVTGNLSIPHNDGWSYSRIAETFGLTGQIVLLGWNRSALIGQIVPLGPLARFLPAQHLFVALLGLCLLLCAYELLRTRIGSVRAGIATAAFAVWPGFALLTTSYMSDIPTAAACLLAVLLADKAMARDSRVLFALSMAAGLWACTIRLPGIAAPVAIVFALVFARRRLHHIRMRFVAGACAAFILLFAGFTYWRSSLDGDDPASYVVSGAPFSGIVESAARGYFELALVAGPIALLFSRPWRWRLRSILVATAIAILGVLLLIERGSGRFFLGNYLSSQGAYSDALVPGRTLFSENVWNLVAGGAILLGAVLAGAVVENWRADFSPLAWFTLFWVAGTVLTGATDQTIYGRYFIPAAPFVMLSVSRPSVHLQGSLHVGLTVLSRALGVVSFAAVFALSAAITLNALAFDMARWRLAEQVAADGTPADRIDAGLEWLGWHSANGVVRRDHSTGWGFEIMFSDSPACRVITAVAPESIQNLPENWTLERTSSYPTYAFFGQSTLYVFDTHAEGCPTI